MYMWVGPIPVLRRRGEGEEKRSCATNDSDKQLILTRQ
jgi:hypothetical protein